MLNSLQIEALLLQQGFTLIDEKAHAVAYQHPSLQAPVYLKDGREYLHAPRKAVAKQPLVLHPDYAQGSSKNWLQDAYEANGVYMNSNMSSFPKYLGTKSRYGVAVAIRDETHLKTLLHALGVPDAVAMDDPAAADIAQARDLPEVQTQRQAVIAARRGQGLFRKLLDTYWGGCAVTGCQVRAVLRASHIKPWSRSTNAERLDPFNGLLLTANLDAAFDQGLISFADDGQLLVNPLRLPAHEALRLGIRAGMQLQKIAPAHRAFLRAHRALHGFPCSV